MALELVKCPHCGYKFQIDLEKREKDGETIAVRSIFSLLEDIYFHAITFSDVKPVLAGSGWMAGIYLAPIVLWLLSLVFAVAHYLIVVPY